jgi:hypothetical protein
MPSHADNVTLIDLLMNGFEKNESIGSWFWRQLPAPDDATAIRKFDEFAAEGCRWKGEPLESVSDSDRRGRLERSADPPERSRCARGWQIREHRRRLVWGKHLGWGSCSSSPWRRTQSPPGRLRLKLRIRSNDIRPASAPRQQFENELDAEPRAPNTRLTTQNGGVAQYQWA